VTVIYTDGTSSTTTVTFADWYSGVAAPGGDVLVTTPDWNHPASEGPHPVSVYATSVPLDPSKTVADVILPTQSQQPTSGPGPFHVFAMGIGS
jgi:beta-glucosidase